MKSQLNKILKIIIILSFFSFSKSYSIEGVNELTDAINEAREEFNNLSETSNEQSKIKQPCLFKKLLTIITLRMQLRL